MSDKEYIRNLVKKHKSKMNAVGITRWTIICLSAGLLAALLVELYSFIWPFYYADIVAIVLMVLGAAAGLVIGFIGAVQFAMGFKDDSADGKTRGLMCLASGFIVFSVAKAYSMFTA